MKHIFGNWKMHGAESDLWAWQEKFTSPADLKPGLFLPFTLLHGQPMSFLTGAQDVSRFEGQGAYTGEISAEMIKETGAQIVLCGHSERRHVLGEDNALVKQKAENALRTGLSVVLCVGEPLDVRESGGQEEYVKRQLLESFPSPSSSCHAGEGRYPRKATDALPDVDPGLRRDDMLKECSIIIAYEPVWAIGTGKVAQLAEIQAMHEFIKKVAPLENMAILYGGSVKADNAREILHTDNVDGVLVSGASLKAEEFQQICEAAL